MSARSWLDDEPSLRDARRELRSAWHTAKRRWPVVLFGALLTAALGVAWSLRRERSHDATLVLRITEHVADPARPVAAEAAIASYLAETLLTRAALLDLAEDLELYPELAENSELRVERFREALEVRAVQNYFDPERYIGAQPRTARVVVRYRGPRPEEALGVVRGLARRIADERDATLRRRTEATARASSAFESSVRAQLLALRREQARLSVSSSASTVSFIHLVGSARTIARVEDELTTITRERTAEELGDSMAQVGLLSTFELVDAGRVASPTLTPQAELVLVGVMLFVVGFALSVVVAGTFHSRIFTAVELARLGLPVLGELGPSSERRSLV